MIETSNSVEALNTQIRRLVRSRGRFPSNAAAMKRICLPLPHD